MVYEEDIMANIRILKTEDLEIYKVLLANNSYTFSWDQFYYQHVSDDYLLNILSPNDKYWNIFGIFKDNELAACVTLRQMRQIGRQHKAIVENLFLKVKEDEVIAQDLVCEVIDYAKEQGIEKLMTCVTSNNISGKIFFTSFGFEMLGLEENSAKVGDEYFDVHWLIYDID